MQKFRTAIKKLLGEGPVRRLRVRLFIFSSIALILGLITPHLFQGQFFIPRQYGESILFLINFVFIFIFICLYFMDLKKIEENKKRSEHLLEDTFKHLGLANRKLELISGFINAYKLGHENIGKRDVIEMLFKHVMVSTLNSPLGIMRVINKSKARTQTEWWFRDGMEQGQLPFPNKKVLSGTASNSQEVHYIISEDIETIDTVCVLGYVDPGDGHIDKEFVITLLNQIHFLVIAFGLLEKKPNKRPMKILNNRNI